MNLKEKKEWKQKGMNAQMKHGNAEKDAKEMTRREERIIQGQIEWSSTPGAAEPAFPLFNMAASSSPRNNELRNNRKKE